MKKESFKSWLPKNNVNSVNRYCGYIAEIEKVTGMTIEEFIFQAVEEKIVKEITAERFKGHKNSSNIRSGARKYFNFLIDKNKRSMALKKARVIIMKPTKEQKNYLANLWHSNVA